MLTQKVILSVVVDHQLAGMFHFQANQLTPYFDFGKYILVASGEPNNHSPFCINDPRADLGHLNGFNLSEYLYYSLCSPNARDGYYAEHTRHNACHRYHIKLPDYSLYIADREHASAWEKTRC